MGLPIRQAVGICLLAVSVGASAPAPPPSALRYRFKEGEKLRYVNEQKVKVSLSVAGNDITFHVKQTLDLVWETLELDKGGDARVSQTVERLRFTVDAPEPLGKFEYDSVAAKAPEGPLREALVPLFKAMVGQAATMTIEPSGKVKNVKLPEAYRKELKKMREAGSGSGLSGETLSRLFEQGGLVLPNYSASKGKVWEHTSASKMPGGKVTVRHVYEHEGVELRGGRRVEVIRIKPTAKFEGDGTQAAVKLKSQEASGKAYFDKAAGRLAETTVTLKMELELDLGGMSVPQKIEQTSTMKVKEK